MKNFLVGVAVASMASSALAQSNAQFDSTNNFTVSVSDPNAVTIAQDGLNGSGQYYLYNGTGFWTPASTGDGQNYLGGAESYNFDQNPGSTYAWGQSTATTLGTATLSNGYNFFIDFTNTSTIEQSFSMTFDVVQHLTATGDASVDAYGGWEAYNSNTVGYFSNSLTAGGSVVSNWSNFSGGQNADGSWEGTSSFTLNLDPGASETVQVWSSGDTTAVAPTPAPEPATLSLGIGAIAMAIRKRRLNRGA